MVVDDDESILELVQMTLEFEGYEVVMAKDGKEALDLLASITPALILLDMQMPDMDGWKFAEEYRQASRERIPLVVMTAGKAASETAAQIQADGYIAKPFDIEDLIDAVNRHAQDGRA